MIRKLFKWSVVLLISFFILDLLIYFIYPNVSKLKKENPSRTSFIKITEKRWRAEGKKRRVSQRWVPYSRISPYLIKAVLIAEDDKFWSHDGFDMEGMEKALEKNMKAKKFKSGGSTISQQLAKNLYLTPSRNPLRKLKEAILTWRIEKILSKKRILEIYLNVAEWGDGVFGIEAASLHYYGKPASALGPEEAARLAVVLPNPKKFNPLKSSRYVENRSRIVYGIMVRRGIVIESIEEELADMQKEDPLTGEMPKEEEKTIPASDSVENPPAPSSSEKSENINSLQPSQ